MRFFGHRRWLRATAYVFTLSTGIVQFLLRGLGGQPGVNPSRDCAEIVRKSCNVSAVAVQSPQLPHRNRTEPVRGLCNATYDMSTGYGPYDFSKFVKLLAKPNRRGRGARESVQKSHSCRLLPPQGGLAEAARKAGYGQDDGSVDPSQAKCELGISFASLINEWEYQLSSLEDSTWFKHSLGINVQGFHAISSRVGRQTCSFTHMGTHKYAEHMSNSIFTREQI